jgi:2-polyprenyl-6-methoxyphenol hydroxylase-like FAD-dependent oxidoreductase
MSEQLQIAIVGGGIGGLTAALALRARGFNVTVFEQGSVLREIGAGVSIHPSQRSASAPTGRPYGWHQEDRIGGHWPPAPDIAW